MREMLEGVFTALVTPFHDDGSRPDAVDWNTLGELVEGQIEAGVHGLVPCGTTGECATLSGAERDQVVRFTVERSAGRVPVLAGTGSNSTAEAMARTMAAREAGADAVLSVIPYYNRPTPEGLEIHYREIAQAGLPVVLYNIPSRTGLSLEHSTYRRLARIPGVTATKEASGNLALAEEILSDGELRLLSGDDALTFPLLCLGAHGVISVVSNIAPRAMVDLFDHVVEGNLKEARDQHRRLLPLMKTLFVETSPAPLKAALASRGIIEDGLRPPLAPARPESRAAVEMALVECNLPLAAR